MAIGGSINIGTLSGRIELEDKFSPAVKRVEKRIDGLGTKIQQAGAAGAASFGKMFAAFTAGGLAIKAISVFTSLATEALSVANSALDMADKLGVSAEAVQRFRFVAEETSTSVQAFEKAIIKLNINLSRGLSDTRNAIQSLGLSFEVFKQLAPEDQFESIALALEQVEDKQNRARLAMEIFGKGGAQILPAIEQGYAAIAAQARVASDEQIAAVDAVVDAFVAFRRNTVTAVLSGLGEIVLAFNDIKVAVSETSGFLEKLGVTAEVQSDFFKQLRSQALLGPFAVFLNKTAEATEEVEEATKKVSKAIEATGFQTAIYADQLALAQKELLLLTEAERKEIRSALFLKVAHEEIGEQLQITEEVVRLFDESEKALKKTLDELAKSQEKVTAAEEKRAQALAELDAIAVGWRQTLISVDQAVIDSAISFLEYGASIGKVKEGLGLTTIVADAINQKFQEQQGILQGAATAADDFADAWTRLNDLGKSQQEILRGVSREAIRQVEIYFELGATVQDLTAAFSLNEAQVRAITIAFQEAKLAAAAERTELEQVSSTVRDTARAYDDLAAAKKRAAQTFTIGVTPQNLEEILRNLGLGGGASQARTLAGEGFSLEEIIAILRGAPKGPPRGPRIPGFRHGGVIDADPRGSLFMAHGRELITPLDGPGRGLSPMNIVINVNGTAAEVARKVADEIMRTVNTRRQFVGSV